MVGDQGAAVQLGAGHEVAVHLRQDLALDAVGLSRSSAANRQIPVRQENCGDRPREMLVCQRWNLSQRSQAVGGRRLGQPLKETELASVVCEILLQLADGGVR